MMYILRWQLRLFIGISILVWLFSGPAASAQVPCGNIIGPDNIFNQSNIVTVPIDDCADPFSLTTNPASPYTLRINGTEVAHGGSVALEEVRVEDIVIEGESHLPTYSNLLYKHENEDYVFVDYDAVIGAGTYTMVIEEYELILSQRSFIERLKDAILPTAFANSLGGYTYAVTFRVTEPIPVPTGASSVLFLPGIMGSRLFEEGEFCDDTDSEQELWFSFSECKQMRLTTNFIGQSVNRVYTKPGLSGILDEALVFNIYKSFLKNLKEWKEEEIINDYAVVPYDWRAELDEVIKSGLDDTNNRIYASGESTTADGYLYKVLSELASSSKSGKVTVVAHSNGGLVIKQFISNLQNSNDPVLEKIDNVILVAVPQIGSPKAALGILNGDSLDPVMSQAVVRRLMNNMAFAHHLLPVTDYFDTVETPVIKFEPGAATNDWIETFGETITSRDELHRFLSKDSGREKPDFADLAIPEVVDNSLLGYAKVAEIVQNNFRVKEGMKVYQIAGVGLETVSSITYFSDLECTSRVLFVCTEYKPKIGYRIGMTIDGDETVPVPSALALAANDQVERRWLDLKSYNNDVLFNRKHNDILEVDDVTDFILSTLESITSTSYTYLTDSVPQIDEGSRLVFQLHSPLDMWLVNNEGKVVSSSTVEIESATYRRYGELQYLSIPRTQEFTLVLNGLATGSFTLDIEEEMSGEIQKRRTYSAIPSEAGIKVVLEINEESILDDSVLVLDYDGDGVSDVSYNTEGVVNEKVTYEDLYQAIQELDLKKLPEALLLKAVKNSENLNKKSLAISKYKKLEIVSLRLLLKQVMFYEHLSLITKNQSLELEKIINQLLNQ